MSFYYIKSTTFLTEWKKFVNDIQLLLKYFYQTYGKCGCYYSRECCSIQITVLLAIDGTHQWNVI